MHLSPQWFRLLSGPKAVILLLLIVSPIVGFSYFSMFCCALLCVHSSFAIILMGKRELVALLGLSAMCLLMVVWIFLGAPRVCLQFVTVGFPNHTHLLLTLGNCFVLECVFVF